jgi:hypothetical protein
MPPPISLLYQLASSHDSLSLFLVTNLTVSSSYSNVI